MAPNPVLTCERVSWPCLLWMGIKHLFSSESESYWVKAVKAPLSHREVSQELRTLCAVVEVVVVVVVTWPISRGVTLWLLQSLPLSVE